MDKESSLWLGFTAMVVISFIWSFIKMARSKPPENIHFMIKTGGFGYDGGKGDIDEITKQVHIRITDHTVGDYARAKLVSGRYDFSDGFEYIEKTLDKLYPGYIMWLSLEGEFMPRVPGLYQFCREYEHKRRTHGQSITNYKYKNMTNLKPKEGAKAEKTSPDQLDMGI